MSNLHRMTRVRRFLRSRDGNIAIITGLLLPVLVGFCALAAETAFWYYRDRDIQGAADIAAFSATVVLRRGGDDTEVEAAATASAAANGWNQANGTIDVNTPPTSGTNQNNLSVEVLLVENQQRFFTKVFSTGTVPINARSVGTYASAGPACFLALDPTGSHAMEFWGNSTANFTSCNVVANSTHEDGLAVGGSASVTVPCAQVAGGAAVTATLTLTDCTTVTEGAEPTPDPYEDLPAPPFNPADCADPPSNLPNPPAKLPAGCYNGLTINEEIELEENGIYIINGGGGNDDLSLNANGSVTGVHVMFYLTNSAKVNMNGNGHLNISAPNSGTYSGVVMFGDRTQPSEDNQLQGDSTSVVTGALYFPSQSFSFTGNYSGANGCMQLVAYNIYYTGNASFGTDCSGTGLYQIPTPGVVSLVE